MERIKVEIDGAEFRRSLDELALTLDAAAAAALQDALATGERHASGPSQYNDRTRRLRSSTHGQVDRANLTATFRNEAPYAWFVDHGTRPHVIEGRPHLAFFWPKVGSFVVFRRVHHPGTAPRPFFREATGVAADALGDSLARRFNEAIR